MPEMCSGSRNPTDSGVTEEVANYEYVARTGVQVYIPELNDCDETLSLGSYLVTFPKALKLEEYCV